MLTAPNGVAAIDAIADETLPEHRIGAAHRHSQYRELLGQRFRVQRRARLVLASTAASASDAVIRWNPSLP
jgi:hypothetical protein